MFEEIPESTRMFSPVIYVVEHATFRLERERWRTAVPLPITGKRNTHSATAQQNQRDSEKRIRDLQMSKASASGLDPEGEADIHTCSVRSR